MVDDSHTEITCLISSPDGFIYGGDAGGNLFSWNSDLERRHLAHFNSEKRQPRFLQDGDFSWYVSRLCLHNSKVFAQSENDDRILSCDTKSEALIEHMTVHEPAGMAICDSTDTLFCAAANGTVTAMDLNTGNSDDVVLDMRDSEAVVDLALLDHSVMIGSSNRLFRLDREDMAPTVVCEWDANTFNFVGMSCESALILWGVSGVFQLSADDKLDVIKQVGRNPHIGPCLISDIFRIGNRELIVIGYENDVLIHLGTQELSRTSLDSRAFSFCYHDGRLVAGLQNGEIASIELHDL